MPTLRASALALIVIATSVGVVVGGAIPAVAAPSDGYATWQATSSAAGYAGIVSVPPGFPDVSFTSTSRVVGASPIQSGASAWIPAGTSFGDTFGSSQGKPYINLRPAADNAAPASASTTVYEFAEPTPVGVWGVAFGDIDAESLSVSGTDATGNPVSAADLGAQEAFNYCDASPRASTCSGLAAPYAVPEVSSSASAVTASDPQCPVTSSRCDTTGEAIWFSPRVPLSSLTVTSSWKQGFPSYQTWFATNSRTVAGTIGSTCLETDTSDVQLIAPSGAVITSTTAVDGEFSLPPVAARADYSLRVDPASLPAGAIANSVDVDVSDADSTDNALTVDARYRAAGTVTSDTADASGIAVALTAENDPGVISSAVSDADGAYSFEDLENGSYIARVSAPAGTSVAPAEQSFVIGCADSTVAPFTLTTDAVIPDPVDPPAPPLPDPVTDPAAGPDPGRGAGPVELPETGAEVAPGLWSALLPLSAGTAMVVFAAMRRRAR
ncbi:hypothetical protein IWX78_000809 [Mycetocola sp. CAN_C7]|uniref:SdrD B-like domain-containing protein n=1 Tax=Mycetocola sp. CAN_C7 TaxID=2787724 RepID=UPI0018CB6665